MSGVVVPPIARRHQQQQQQQLMGKPASLRQRIFLTLTALSRTSAASV